MKTYPIILNITFDQSESSEVAYESERAPKQCDANKENWNIHEGQIRSVQSNYCDTEKGVITVRRKHEKLIFIKVKRGGPIISLSS